MDAEKFGAFISQCRKEKQMTQAELARQTPGYGQGSQPLGTGNRIPGHQHHRAPGRRVRHQCRGTYEV